MLIAALLVSLIFHALLLLAIPERRRNGALALQHERGQAILIGPPEMIDTDWEQAVLNLFVIADPAFLTLADNEYGFSSGLKLDTALAHTDLPQVQPEQDFSIAVSTEPQLPDIPSSLRRQELADAIIDKLQAWNVLHPPLPEPPRTGTAPSDILIWRFQDGRRLEHPPAVDLQALEAALKKTKPVSHNIIEISLSAGLIRTRLRLSSGNRELDLLLLAALGQQLRYQEHRRTLAEPGIELLPAEGESRTVEVEPRLFGSVSAANNAAKSDGGTPAP